VGSAPASGHDSGESPTPSRAAAHVGPNGSPVGGSGYPPSRLPARRVRWLPSHSEPRPPPSEGQRTSPRSPSGGQHRAWWRPLHPASTATDAESGASSAGLSRRSSVRSTRRSGTLSHRYSVRRWSIARRASSRLAVLALATRPVCVRRSASAQHRDRSDGRQCASRSQAKPGIGRLLVVDAVALVAWSFAGRSRVRLRAAFDGAWPAR